MSLNDGRRISKNLRVSCIGILFYIPQEMQFPFLSLQCCTDSTVILVLSRTPSGNALNSVLQIKV